MDTTDTIAPPSSSVNTAPTATGAVIGICTPIAVNPPPPQVQPAVTCPNVVTIPVPIVQNEEYYAYVTVKGSLHDRSCAAFGLNEAEIQALSKRYENGVKPVVNGIMVNVPPMVLVNTLAQLSYKVVCSCGEAEICWTMQREI